MVEPARTEPIPPDDFLLGLIWGRIEAEVGGDSTPRSEAISQLVLQAVFAYVENMPLDAGRGLRAAVAEAYEDYLCHGYIAREVYCAECGTVG